MGPVHQQALRRPGLGRGRSRHDPLAGQVRALRGQAEQVIDVRSGPGYWPLPAASARLRWISAASSEGEPAAGNFVEPALFTDVTNDMTIAREEIFGPVLPVIPFSDEDEAVRIANGTDYGLAATVWTSDLKRAIRMTTALRAGAVGVNGYQLEPHAAFGGYGQSWLGRRTAAAWRSDSSRFAAWRDKDRG